MIKIVYCIFGTYSSGGVERILSSKVNYLVTHGYDVTLITTNQKGRPPFYPLNEQIKCIDLGINYDDVAYLSRLKKHSLTALKKCTHKRKLRELLLELRADIVVSTGFHEAGFLPSIKDGSKKILEFHLSQLGLTLMTPNNNFIWKTVGWGRIKLKERSSQKYDRFVILTKEDQEYWKNNKNIVVIPNFTHPVGNLEPSALQSKLVVSVGRLEHQKQFMELLDIWRLIPLSEPEYQGWKLEIIGNGYLHDDLQAKIKQLGIEDSVSLLPATKEIFKKYSQSSIYACPSRYEGLPMVLLESQMVGLPLVSYACPCGPRDVIAEGESGYLVPVGDKELFAQRLMTLMKDESLRQQMGVRALENAKRFTMDAVMAQWEQLFHELTKK